MPERLTMARVVAALQKWGLVRWMEDDDGGRFAKDTGRKLVRCRECGVTAVVPKSPRHKKGCEVGAILALAAAPEVPAATVGAGVETERERRMRLALEAAETWLVDLKLPATEFVLGKVREGLATQPPQPEPAAPSGEDWGADMTRSHVLADEQRRAFIRARNAATKKPNP